MGTNDTIDEIWAGLLMTSGMLGALAEVSTTTCVARQRIEDCDGQTVGFEVLFRPHADAQSAAEGWSFDDDVATARVMTALASQFEVRDVSGDGLLFVNVPRSFLVRPDLIPIDADSVVLEVLEGVAIDAEVLFGIDRLLAEGFVLAFDDLGVDDPRLPFVDRCAFVKIDVQQVPSDQLGPLVAQVRAACEGVQLVAERLETPEQMERARAAGFDLFQGYLVNRPTTLVAEDPRPQIPLAVTLVARLFNPMTNLPDLADLVLSDAALTRTVMRQVNSVSGARAEVTDIVQALNLLGRSRLRALLMLELMQASGHHDPEVPLLALARTRAVEALAPDAPLDAAVEALARMCTTVLGMSSEDVAEWLPRITGSPTATLACDALDQYLEAADHTSAPVVLPSGFTPLQVSMAWLHGLRDARDLLETVPQPRRGEG
ncbi:MAG: EAL domain-containing protein [Micrococcales bacterium]|nr:EAL domain-containing protein [Micrococcales bacterium]